MIKPTFECEKCHQSYKMASNFRKHVCKKLKVERVDKPVTQFECMMCHKHYSTELGLMNHICKAKARLIEIQSPLGQAAYLFYSKWMRSSRKAVPPITTFTASRFYVSFIRFAKFYKAVKLVDADLYIKVMNAKEIGPELWTDDRAYGIYLDHMEFHIDPNSSARITAKTLEKLSEEYNCEISDVFTMCNRNEIIQLIRERRLSPWILLRSRRFMEFLRNCSTTQVEIVETLIDSNFWSKRFAAHPKVKSFMTLCAKELGI